jgi:hypothetical protein
MVYILLENMLVLDNCIGWQTLLPYNGSTVWLPLNYDAIKSIQPEERGDMDVLTFRNLPLSTPFFPCHALQANRV